MRAPEHRLLPGIIAAALGTSAWAQQNPGLTTQPSGRTLTEPDTPPAEQPVDLSRPERKPPILEVRTEEQAFFEAATRGEAWAQTRLGKLYVESPDDPVRLQLGLELLNAAAAAGIADAFFELAKMALAGRGIERSPSTAFGYMKQAAELGLPDAEYELASMYSEGRGTAKDPVAALLWARKAAANSHPKAAVAVGAIMLQSQNRATQTEGLEMINRAVASGDKEAALALATAYARGDQCVLKDEKRAEELLKPHADKGDAESQFALASLYQFGDSFAARRDEAQVWLQRAADQGHPRALEILGSESEER